MDWMELKWVTQWLGCHLVFVYLRNENQDNDSTFNVEEDIF